ncbi:MAG: hypothetical protein ABWW65_03105 [Thermoprotei archaeon]
MGETSHSSIAKLLNIKLYFEGPSDWSTREFIEILNEYLFERLPVMINNVLEPYGLEAYVVVGEDVCRIISINNCRDYVAVVVQDPSSDKAVLYAIYYYRVGDNTLEFQLKETLVP